MKKETQQTPLSNGKHIAFLLEFTWVHVAVPETGNPVLYRKNMGLA